ncbi:MAG: glycine--tRNA ligase, partial [Nanoarchaeota archaeon]
PVIKEKQEKQIKKEIKPLTIDELTSFCKRKGFVFKSSEIYGGFSGFWDYGSLGAELFNNIRQDFWKFFVHDKENMIGIDASIISHPRTWEASGHVESFKDVSVRCRKCKKFNKVDKAELDKARCSFCNGELDKGTAKDLNLMFKTNVGPVEEESVISYLRPETAQGMFLDFKQIAETSRMKLPFGILQIGKCFRNEIAPRDFLFRDREFTIAEFEFFIHPDEKKCPLLDKEHLNLKLRLLDKETQTEGKEELKETTIKKMLDEKRLEEWHAYWLAEQLLWFKKLGLIEKIKIREHMKDELSHYSSATFDVDYEYPFGSREVAGNANRGQYDLKQHEKFSGEKMEVFDEESKKKIIPRVIEPTFGIDRVFLALLSQAYEYDEKRQNIVLKLPAFLAPIKAAVFPIVKGEFEKLAREVYLDLKKSWNVVYDTGGSLGRRYARMDEAGCPFCITIDGDSLKKKDVTIRNRDTTEQVRVLIKDLKNILRRLIFENEEFLKTGKKVETRVLEGKI